MFEFSCHFCWLIVTLIVDLGSGILREPRHFGAHQQTDRRGVCPATAAMGLAGRQHNSSPHCDHFRVDTRIRSLTLALKSIGI